MHPEYPCSHCIQSGSVAAVVKAVLGGVDIPEVALTSPATPGVTHRWTNMTVFTEEIANARIWAGFHYRFSTRVGTDIGLQIGEYVVKNVMQRVISVDFDISATCPVRSELEHCPMQSALRVCANSGPSQAAGRGAS